MPVPVLYSFRRCPYAIRARMALFVSGIEFELREVLLKDKPTSLLGASPKGTVPVLLLSSNGEPQIIDESLDIMHWAIRQNTDTGLSVDSLSHSLVRTNDDSFKAILDRYKYFERYPEQSQAGYFSQAIPLLKDLEGALESSGGGYFLGEQAEAIDVAIFPFVRQFAFVDRTQFSTLELPKLQTWLANWLKSSLFKAVMQKHPRWQEGDIGVMIKHDGTPPVHKVVHVPDQYSFIIDLGAETNAFLRYEINGENQADIVSTQVPRSHRGLGLAGMLVDAAFVWIKEQGYELKTSCWYAQKRRDEMKVASR